MCLELCQAFLHPRYSAGRLAVFIPVFIEGDTEARRGEAASPSRWVTEPPVKPTPLTEQGQCQ